MADHLILFRLEGPADDATPPRVTLSADTEVGRSVECGLCLAEGSVSRRHASLRRMGRGWCLTDEGSTSGTTLNGRRLAADSPAPLEPGDRIGIGPWLFRVGDEATVTRAVGLTMDGPSSALPISTKRLDALSACLDAMERAGDAEELALAVLRACMEGTGFARAAVLLPGGGGGGEGAVLLAGLVRAGGRVSRLEPEEFAPSRSLIETARSGRTAVHGVRPGGGVVAGTHSIVEMAIHSGLCVPVMLDGRPAALVYLDARSGESVVRDAAGFCEDIARMYGFALARDAQAELSRRQAALRVELERARELRAMLAPAPVARAGQYRHASRTIAGLFVSADLFDAVGHADGSATVLFGDASGHGVGAAMLAALVQSHLASALAAGMGLERAVAQTNRFVATRPTGGRFVSVVAALLGPDGTVRMVDAGHGHWMIARRGGEAVHPERATAMPLGIDPGASFVSVDWSLGVGDRLVCFTDGIPDQTGEERDAFGFARLEAAVGSSDSCESDVVRVFDALQRHAGGRPLDDDATVASVQFDPV